MGDEGWNQGSSAAALDLIISTVSFDKLPLPGYLNLLSFWGTFVQVGAPADPLLAFLAFTLIVKAVHITGSCTGSPKEIEEMLQFVADKGVKPWMQLIPIEEANRAIVEFEDGKPRYRQ
ncbi:alcohol dehydrogenase (NADP+) [Alternaria panax]|uniref:Alcohol dehydrogenase (NADP+) n=1 Tax=Alternaria panax TaxID=48097 RepID=A0AAD4NNS3_9PLEO|nr:alcohol dehydrogenase (NADP+) [Alternaria panax]